MQQVHAVEAEKPLVLSMTSAPASHTISSFMKDLEKAVLDWAKKRTDLRLARTQVNGKFICAFACSNRKQLTDLQVSELYDFVEGLLKKWQGLTATKVRDDKIFVTLKFSQEAPSLS